MMRRHAETAEKDIAERQCRFGCCLFFAVRLKQDDENAFCEIIGQYTGYVYAILRNFSYGAMFSKRAIYLNGEKQDYDAELVSDDASDLPAADAAD